MTLLEVAIASFLFVLMAVSVLTGLLQTRKIAENNVAQATAAVIAQGIIEQVQLDNFNDLINGTYLPLNFTGPTSNNLSTIQPFTRLVWATDATTFTDIGTQVDPTDPTSAVLGVLIDMDYKNGTTVIRPRRYMKMRVNLQRIVATGTKDNVQIILTYSWQPPSGNGAATAPFITREIRTIRSMAPSY